jgi:serine protease Do
MRGEVIGMNSQIATSTGDYNGIGFALPANETAFVYKQLIEQGKVKRGYLGITLESVHDEYAKVYGMTEAKGAIITSVTAEEKGQATPAAKAGLQPNDIIVDFENAPVLNAQDLIQRVASTPVGQQVTLGFLRDVNGKFDKKTVSVALGERPPSPSREWIGPTTTTPKSNSDPRGNALHLGITLAELTPQLLAERRMTGVQGLYLKDIDPNGLVAELRNPGGQQVLVEGDIINRINRVPVTSLADFQRVLTGLKSGDPIVLNVTRIQRDVKGDKQVPLIIQFTYQ